MFVGICHGAYEVLNFKNLSSLHEKGILLFKSFGHALLWFGFGVRGHLVQGKLPYPSAGVRVLFLKAKGQNE